MLILDSNTIGYYFRGDPQVVPRLQAIPPSDIFFHIPSNQTYNNLIWFS